MQIDQLDFEHSVYEKFLKGVVVDENGCWLRTIYPNRNGYTRLMYSYKGVRYDMVAHRYSYSVFVGPIPAGLLVDHLCRVRNCCNPDHLEAVTHSENTKRGDAGKLLAKWKTRNK